LEKTRQQFNKVGRPCQNRDRSEADWHRETLVFQCPTPVSFSQFVEIDGTESAKFVKSIKDLSS